MWIVRTCMAGGLAALASLAILVSPAVAQDCNWYARKALEQQKENADRKCGFRGPEWHVDLSAHMSWCRNTAPREWQRQAQLRDQQLAKCGGARR
jgi:hypothetical protein